MNKFVSDTMALVLYLEERKLPNKVNKEFNRAAEEKIKIFIPAISLAEIGYLNESDRINTTLEQVNNFITSQQGFEELTLSSKIISTSFEITDVPDLHDRLIAGSAKLKELPILTNDPDLQNSGFVDTIWS